MPALEHRTHSYHGWKPSLPDHRDLIADTNGLAILDYRDPRSEMSKPYDQSDLGSCTANTVAAAVEYDALFNGDAFGTPSRLFIYYGEREIEGTVDSDSGAFGRDGFKVCHKLGVPAETDWPYDVDAFREKPSDKAFQDAEAHRISAYKAVPRSITHFKRVLSNRQTIGFGFSVYESFESQEVAKSGVVPVPDPGERMLGGHEVLMVGYLKDEPHYALCRNSWGPDWGLGGYFLMPWSILLDRRMSSDFRTIPRPAGG